MRPYFVKSSAKTAHTRTKIAIRLWLRGEPPIPSVHPLKNAIRKTVIP